jgi:hypothetical protein
MEEGCQVVHGRDRLWVVMRLKRRADGKRLGEEDGCGGEMMGWYNCRVVGMRDCGFVWSQGRGVAGPPGLEFTGARNSVIVQQPTPPCHH